MNGISANNLLKVIKPHRLVAGQTIGLLAPASPPKEPEGVRIAMEIIESLGFKVKPATHLSARSGYLAGDDSARVNDLNAMFADENVDAIFCERGGYGSSRLLPMLHYSMIKANPKALIGYSDYRITPGNSAENWFGDLSWTNCLPGFHSIYSGGF